MFQVFESLDTLPGDCPWPLLVMPQGLPLTGLEEFFREEALCDMGCKYFSVCPYIFLLFYLFFKLCQEEMVYNYVTKLMSLVFHDFGVTK